MHETTHEIRRECQSFNITSTNTNSGNFRNNIRNYKRSIKYNVRQHLTLQVTCESKSIKPRPGLCAVPHPKSLTSIAGWHGCFAKQLHIPRGNLSNTALVLAFLKKKMGEYFLFCLTEAYKVKCFNQ